MQAVDIVQANWRDARTLVALDKRCFPRSDAYGWLTYVGLCVWPGVVALKAVAGARLIGFVAGDPRSQAGYAVIVTLQVDAAWRRQGLGERLMHTCEAQIDLPRFRLQVRQGNTAAIRLYQKLGYAIIDGLPGYYGDGEDGYLMEKMK